jgi:transposase-like protein
VKYPSIAQAWRLAWEHVIPLSTITRTRSHFPSDGAAIKLLWLAPCNLFADKVRSAKKWDGAMHKFGVMYGDRFTRIKA